jgi:hypothetical protein
MENTQDTKVWLSGIPVNFVKWTPNGLVYTQVDPESTAAHISRGTIKRLMVEGLLEIEGFRPDWAYFDGDGTH